MRFSGGLNQTTPSIGNKVDSTSGQSGSFSFIVIQEAPTTPNNTWYLTVSSRYEGSETWVEPTATPHARAFVEQPDLCRCWTSQRWMSLLCWTGMCRTLSRIGPLKLRADWQMLEFMSHLSYRSTWDLSESQYVILPYSVKTGPDQTSARGYGAVISLVKQDEAAASQRILHKGHKLAISEHEEYLVGPRSRS